MKGFLGCVAILLGNVCAGQSLDLPQKVTLTIPASRLKPAVEALAKAGNTHLEVAPQIASEIVVLDVTNIPLQDALKKIAEVSSAKWVKEGQVLRLIADTDKRQAEELESRKMRVARIAKAMTGMLDQDGRAPSAPTTTTAAAAAQVERSESRPGRSDEPLMKALSRLVASVGATNLATLEQGQRVVFSSSPTRMQKPLGSAAAAIVASLIREQAALIAAEATKPKRTKNEEDEGGPLREAIETPAKTLLIFSRSIGSDDISVALRLYNSEGTVVTEQNDVLSTIVEGSDAPKDLPAAKDQIAFSTESKALLATISSFTSMGGEFGTNQVLSKALERPTEFDPLRFLVSDGAIALGKAYGKALVACVPDSSVRFFESGPDLNQTVGGFAKRLLRSEVNMTVDADWVSLKPIDPAKARRDRVDRAALERVTLTSDRLMPSLDDLAALVSAAPAAISPEFGVVTLYLALKVPGAMMLVMGGPSGTADSLRFYGTLSVGQRQAISQGSRLPFSSFSPAQRSLLQGMVYGADGRLSIEDPNEKKGPANPYEELMEGMESPFGFMGMGISTATGDYRSEPTELFAHGLPGDGYLEIDSKKQDAVLGDSTNLMSVMLGSMTAGQLGSWGGMGGAFGQEGMPDPFGSAIKYRTGSKTNYIFNFRISPSASVKGVLTEQNFARSTPAVVFGQLPEAFRKQVEVFKQKFKEQMSEMGNGADPPPPAR